MTLEELYYIKEMQRNQPIAFPQNFYAASPAPVQPASSETQSPQP